MAKGGTRAGAGRPKGSLTEATKEKMRIEAALHGRILSAVDRMFNAQLALAEGLTFLYRIDEVGTGKAKRREHVLVTDPEEIKEVLDETDGAAGLTDGGYYTLTTKPPDNKAIDSMLDRVFGKALTKTELTGKNGEPIAVTWKSSSITNPGGGRRSSTPA